METEPLQLENDGAGEVGTAAIVAPTTVSAPATAPAEVTIVDELAALYGLTPDQFMQAEREAEAMFQAYKTDLNAEERLHFKQFHLAWFQNMLRGLRISTPLKAAFLIVLAGLLINEGVEAGSTEMIQRGTHEAVNAILSVAIGIPALTWMIRKIRNY